MSIIFQNELSARLANNFNNAFNSIASLPRGQDGTYRAAETTPIQLAKTTGRDHGKGLAKEMLNFKARKKPDKSEIQYKEGFVEGLIKELSSRLKLNELGSNNPYIENLKTSLSENPDIQESLKNLTQAIAA